MVALSTELYQRSLPRTQRFLADGAVIIFYMLAACLFTYPMVFKLGEAFLPPGHLEGNDLTHFYWTFWWVKKALMELHVSPYYTDYIFYPVGTTLVFHTLSLLNSVLSIPFQEILGIIKTYNLFYLFSLVLAAYGAYRLTFYLTGSRLSAVFAGVIFSFNMHHWDKYGQINLSNYGWIPFFCLYYIKMIKEDRWSNIWLAAVFLAFSAASEWAQMIFIFLFIFIFLIWLALTKERLKLPELIKKTLIMVVFFSVIISPVAYPLVRTAFFQSGFSYQAESWLLDVQSIFGYVIYKGGYAYFFNWGLIFGYVGCLAALLSLAQYRQREVMLWLLTFIFFFIITLGPYWVYRGHVYKNMPLPFLFLSKVPILNGVRHPFRYWTMDMLALSVLSAYALNWAGGLLQKLKHGKKLFWGLATLLIALALLSNTVIPKAAWSGEVPGIYNVIAADPGDFAVLEVPLMGYTEGTHMYYQTIHGKRVLGAHISRIPPSAYDFIKKNGFTSFLAGLQANRSLVGAEKVTPNDIEELKEKRIKYVIIHKFEMCNNAPNSYKKQRQLDKFIPLPFNSAYKGLYLKEDMEIYIFRKDNPKADTISEVIFKSQKDLDGLLEYMEGWFGPPVSENKDIVAYRLF